MIKKIAKIIGKIALGFIIAVGIGIAAAPHHVPSRVVLLGAPGQGTCSGIQVHTPKGKDLILSAAHCLGIAKNGVMPVTAEDGRKFQLKVIAEDGRSDLIIIDGIPGMKGIPIAKVIERGMEAHTYTHGRGYPTYHTEGVIITEIKTEIGLFSINTDADLKRCMSKPKYKVMQDLFGAVCTVSARTTITNAMMVPGSSGGPITDSRGRLIGICSGGDDKFTAIVRLKDIQIFLRNR